MTYMRLRSVDERDGVGVVSARRAPLVSGMQAELVGAGEATGRAVVRGEGGSFCLVHPLYAGVRRMYDAHTDSYARRGRYNDVMRKMTPPCQPAVHTCPRHCLGP